MARSPIPRDRQYGNCLGARQRREKAEGPPAGNLDRACNYDLHEIREEVGQGSAVTSRLSHQETRPPGASGKARTRHPSHQTSPSLHAVESRAQAPNEEQHKNGLQQEPAFSPTKPTRYAISPRSRIKSISTTRPKPFAPSNPDIPRIHHTIWKVPILDKERCPRETPCPRCGGEANYHFLDEARSCVEVS